MHSGLVDLNYQGMYLEGFYDYLDGFKADLEIVGSLNNGPIIEAI